METVIVIALLVFFLLIVPLVIYKIFGVSIKINRTNREAMDINEPTKHDVIWNIIQTNRSYLTKLALTHRDGDTDIRFNPLKPPRAGSLIIQTLAFSTGTFNTAAVEKALRTLLGYEYDKYYRAAREQLIEKPIEH